MRYLIFDIETGPRADAAEYLKPYAPPANWKDPAKIELARRAHVEKELDRAALSAETCEVLAVGVWHWNDGTEIYDTGDEAQTLTAFWDAWEKTGSHCEVVGFNCRDFDIPVLIRRSYALGVRVPYDVCNYYRGRVTQNERIKDLMQVWGCGVHGERISLNRLARVLGVGSKEEGAGKYYHQLRKDDPEAARDYLVKDVELTWHVALKMGVVK